jgi:hypothetical protein
VAFLRFTRDKRGVENFYLVQPIANRRGKVRPRVLYWFRSPPDVKVGREPFDAEMRRALEARNPGIDFDWREIVETPIPSADADKWRERRRAERAAKHAATEGEPTQAGADEEPAFPVVVEPLPPGAGAEASANPDAGDCADVAASQTSSIVARSSDRDHRLRRRRRGGGRREETTAPASSATSDSVTEPSGD